MSLAFRTRLSLAVALVAIAASAQDPLKTLPKNYWLEFQNPWVKVVHAHYPANETIATHDHPGGPTLFVYLNDAGGLRFVHTGTNELPIERKPVKMGQLRIAVQRAETHRVESLSADDSESLRVEFTDVKLPPDMPDARIPAADATFWSSDKPEHTDYDANGLKITRYGVPASRERFFRSTARRVLWIVLQPNNGRFNGKPAHAGQCWTSSMLGVSAGKERIELLRVEMP